MKKNKKKLIIGLALSASFAVLGLGALAVYTARDDSDFVAQVGTVEIDISNLNMTNASNINPGDNDPDTPSDAAAGTDHVFQYTVTNLGTKSVRTRHTIMLTATSDEGEQMDARYLGMFNDNNEIAEKTYVLEDDTEVESLEGLDDDVFVKAVKYVFMSDVMDGFGTAIAEGGEAEIEDLADVITKDTIEDEEDYVDQIYYYDFALLRGADNDYQDANFTVDVVVEAMQYRNTDERDWSDITTVSRTFTTADLTQDYVPARDEDANGEKISSDLVDPSLKGIRDSESPVSEDSEVSGLDESSEESEEESEEEAQDTSDNGEDSEQTEVIETEVEE